MAPCSTTPPFPRTGEAAIRDSDLLRQLFETVLSRCIEEGLVGGEGFAVDGSLIAADASRQKGIEAAEWTAPEAVS
jgi:transposase